MIKLLLVEDDTNLCYIDVYKRQEVPPVKKVVDTTGAGDYYAAGFLYGLTCGYSLEKSSIIGSILASNVIQVVGTTLSKKKWDEIKLNIEVLLQA